MQYTSETMLVKSKDSGESGIFAEVSAGQAGWDYLNMAAMRLRRGESFSVETRRARKCHRHPGRRLRYRHYRWRIQERGSASRCLQRHALRALYFAPQGVRDHGASATRWNSPLAGRRPIRTSRRNWSPRL